jgi:hypothetical protein
MKPGHIFSVVFCGDVYKFYVDSSLNLVKIEKILLGVLNDGNIPFDEVPKAVKEDLLIQLHRHDNSQEA